MRISTFPACLFILSLFEVVSFAQKVCAATIYEVTDLGTLGQGNYSFAFGMNNYGQIVGGSFTGFDENNVPIEHAFIWQNGVMRDLGTLGGSYSVATGVNNFGQVVGYSAIDGDTGSRAFVWSADTGMVPLGTLSGNFSMAFAINDVGQVVGMSSTAESNLSNGVRHAVSWNAGVIQDLGTLNGGFFSVAYGINNQGQIVGASYLDNGSTSSAVLWEGTSVTVLDTLGGNLSLAASINNLGQIVGYSYAPDQTPRAVLWNGTSIQNLNLVGGNNSGASFINNFGQIVGGQFLWSGGTAINLDNFLITHPGFIFDGAIAINDLGQIAGVGSVNGGSRAVLLTPTEGSIETPTPVPVAGGLTLFATGLLGFGIARRSRPLAPPRG